jgi:hypothetical protein
MAVAKNGSSDSDNNDSDVSSGSGNIGSGGRGNNGSDVSSGSDNNGSKTAVSVAKTMAVVAVSTMECQKVAVSKSGSVKN